jgi:ketosteroid isomerase-like protein
MDRGMDSQHHQGANREPAPSLLDRIRRALDDKDLDALAELYTEDATLEEVSSLSPPSHPVVLRGREAIRARLRREILQDPISGWTRRLESATLLDGLETADAIAFTELRTYAAGDKAVAQHVARKYAGRIEADHVVCAWDAD